MSDAEGEGQEREGAARRGTRPGPQTLRASAAVALSLPGDTLLYAVLPLYGASFGLSMGAVGLLLGVNRFIRLLSNRWAEAAFRRWGRARPFRAAMALAAATTWSYGAGWGFWPLLVMRVLWGMVWSVLRLGGYLAVMDEAAARARGRLMGFYQAAARLGSVAGAAGGGLLVGWLGFGPAFQLLAALTLLGLFPAWHAFAGRRDHTGSDPGEPVRSPDDKGVQPGATTAAVARDGQPGAAGVLHGGDAGDEDAAGGAERPGEAVSPSDGRLVLGGAMLFQFLVSGIVVATLAVYLRGAFGQSVSFLGITVVIAALAGILISLAWVSDITLSWLSGRWADHHGSHRVAGLAAGTAGVMMGALTLGFELGATVAVVALLFAASTGLKVSLDTLAGRLAAAGDPGDVLSRYVTWADAGSAAGPVVGLWLVDQLGVGPVYLAAALLFLLMAAAFWRARA